MPQANLLVVDDEATIRSFIVRVLEREGYTVSAAANGQEALYHLDRQDYDLLLTDIKMDNLDGVALLREAKARHPELAVILFTGHATVPSAVEALRRGAFDYLLKPVKNDDLLEAVDGALSNRSREQRRDQLENLAGQMFDLLEAGEESQKPLRQPDTVIELNGLRLDTAAYIATLHGERLDLTPTEFRLLVELSRAPGVAFDFVKLVQSACGYSCTRQEAREIIGTHVLNLRQKLGISPDEPLYVESVRGVGYRLVPPQGY